MFQVGDIVLCKANPIGDVRKFGPKWKGPYKVIRRVAGTSYYLQDVEGKDLSRPWNAQHLRHFYC